MERATMQTTTEINPNIARQIIADASSQGLPVEVYLKKIIEENERLEIMREAMNDELFLADLEEIKEDFRHTDFE
jgi:hypothetical protein